MRRYFIIFLVILAIPIYIWNVYLIVHGMLSSDQAKSLKSDNSASTVTQLPLTTVVHFVEKGKSPFCAFATDNVVESKLPGEIKRDLLHAQKSVPKKSVAAPIIPAVTISGIMWNPTNPIVMIILPDQSSVTARVGTKFSGFEVKKIERTRVRLKYGSTEQWINK